MGILAPISAGGRKCVVPISKVMQAGSLGSPLGVLTLLTLNHQTTHLSPEKGGFVCLFFEIQKEQRKEEKERATRISLTSIPSPTF